MKSRFRITRSMMSIVLVLLFLSACGEKSSSPESSVDECYGESSYGPSGGTIEITDPAHEFYGLRIVVPAGALEECRSLSVNRWSWVSALPNGYYAYPEWDTQFELATGGELPYDLELEFYFVVNGMTLEEGESPCAFGYDDRDEEWKIILADGYDGKTLQVNTTYLPNWAWGSVSLDDVEPESLSEAMKEKHGETEWNSAIAGITQAINLMKTLYVDTSCETWIYMRDVHLPALIQQQRDLLISYQPQISDCGECNLLSSDFGLTLSEYILAHIVVLCADLWDAFAGEVVGYMPFLSDIAFLINCEKFIAMSIIEDVVCDFPCVTEQVGISVYTTYALHHVYMITHYLVSLAIDGGFWVMCQ